MRQASTKVTIWCTRIRDYRTSFKSTFWREWGLSY